MLPRQGEGHPRVAGGASEFPSTGDRDDNELATAGLVARRRGGGMQRELEAPEFFTIIRVKGAQLFVARATGDDDAGGGEHGSTKVFLSGLWNAFRRELWIFAERHFPGDLAG